MSEPVSTSKVRRPGRTSAPLASRRTTKRGTTFEPLPLTSANASNAPRARRQTVQSGPLISSAGPEPDTPLEQVRLTIGVIIGTHGVVGELRVRVVSDNPEQFVSLKSVYVGDEERPRRVQQVRFHASNVLMKLRGIANPEEGAKLRNEPLRISGQDAMPAGEGEFFLYQLIGLEAFDEQNGRIGKVIDLIETGARDVFVIDPGDGSAPVLLPNQPDVVLEVSPVDRRMIVRPLVYLD